MTIIRYLNAALTAVFFLCYAYQLFYLLVPLIRRRRNVQQESLHRFAVLISARNEEAVIGQLLASIHAQTYPAELTDIYVVADNCTDNTAGAALAAGAKVLERFDREHVGKGYALNWLLNRIDRSRYDGFFVFDADNVLDEHYVEEMNRTFSSGYPIVTSYRNSKNYGDNWISAGYALWFLREARFLNDARMRLGTGCAVSGTGFLFSRDIIEETDGWNFFLLTEDIEFTVHHTCAGRRIGYCDSAMFYDEQPVTFRQSWRQRLRWARGYLQVFAKYGGKLLRGIFRGSFSCFDMAMNIMPAAVLSILALITNTTLLILELTVGTAPLAVLLSAAEMLGNTYLTLFLLGGITTFTEWRRIYAPAWKKLLYTMTFPLFMMTYIPISFTALFARNLGWKPIEHHRAVSLREIRTK